MSGCGRYIKVQPFLPLSHMADVKPVTPGWANIFRPWTLHGAVIPVLIGGAVAFKDGNFCWWIFLMVLVCGCLLQSAANILNTYGDYIKGADTVDNESRSPELVSGMLNPKSVFWAGAACLAIVALCGLVFIWYIGWGILIFGLLGLAGASLYTVGPSYKYHGLGQFSVFIMMGILMPLGTYYVMSGQLSWEVFLLSLPNAFMITAVLAGNETRDYYEDRKVHVGTQSQHLSYRASMFWYRFTCTVSFPILAVLLVCGAAPWPCVLAFLSLYDAYVMWQNSRQAPADAGRNRLLVPLAFKLNWHFGVLLVAGCLIGYYLAGMI